MKPDMAKKLMLENTEIYIKSLLYTTKQATLVFFMRFVGYFLGFVSQIFYASLLGPEQYGIFALGITILQVSGLIASFGLPIGLNRFLGELLGKGNKKEASTIVRSAVLVSFFIAGIIAFSIFVYSSHITIKIFQEPLLLPFIPFVCLLIILQTEQNIFGSTVQGLKRPSIAFFSQEVVIKGSRLILFLVFYFLGFGLWGLYYSTCLSILFSLLFLGYWSYKNANFIFHKSYEDNGENSKEFFKYSGQMFFVSMVNFLSEHVNKLLLSIFMAAKFVGFYYVTYSVASLSAFFLQSFNAIFAPTIAELYHTDQMNSLSRMYSTLTRWILTLTIPVTIWMLVFSDGILDLFGKDFIQAKTALFLLAIGQLINSTAGPCGKMLSMSKHQKIAMINGSITAILNIILNVIFIPRIGVAGAALAALISISGINILKLMEVYFLMGIHPYSKRYYKPIIGTLVTLIGTFLIRLLGTYVLIIILALPAGYIFMAVTLWLIGFEEEDRFILSKFLGKFATFSRRSG